MYQETNKIYARVGVRVRLVKSEPAITLAANRPTAPSSSNHQSQP
jgi:hypothetical protein